jgi:hypothetical protein
MHSHTQTQVFKRLIGLKEMGCKNLEWFQEALREDNSGTRSGK